MIFISLNSCNRFSVFMKKRSFFWLFFCSQQINFLRCILCKKFFFSELVPVSVKYNWSNYWWWSQRKRYNFLKSGRGISRCFQEKNQIKTCNFEESQREILEKSMNKPWKLMTWKFLKVWLVFALLNQDFHLININTRLILSRTLKTKYRCEQYF